MSSRPTILVFAGSHEEGDSLATRLRAVGFRPVLAKTPDEAQTIAGDRRLGIRAALLSAELPVLDFGATLRGLRECSLGGWLEVVAVGRKPSPERIAEIEQAGVRLVVHDPAPDAVLRFQLNRALDARQHVHDREADRVPVARRLRIISGSFAKPAALYTLSTSGAFVETPRPSLRGARVRLELLLARADVAVEGAVVYTNVPGNLRRESLPVGMGVRFIDVSRDAQRAIEACVEEGARLLSFEPPAASSTSGPSAGLLRRIWRRGRKDR